MMTFYASMSGLRHKTSQNTSRNGWDFSGEKWFEPS